MYQHTLRIVAFTTSSELAEELHALIPRQRFTHDVRILDEFLPSALAQADIAIVDLPVPLSFGEARSRMLPESMLIWCLTREEEEKLDEADLAFLDDVWLKPVRPPRIRLRMRNMLKGIKRDFDARQHIIWLDTLIDSMPDLVWFKDLDGIHHKVNRYFCQFVHKDRKEVEGSTHGQIWGVSESDVSKGEYTCRESENAAIASGTTYLTEEIVQTGGEKHLLKTFKTPLKGPAGEILGTVGFAHDLTNLLNLGMELDIFIEAMPFPLILCDSRGRMVQLNSQFLSFFKVKREEVLDQSYDEWQAKFFHMETSPINGERYIRFNAGEGLLASINIVEKDITDIFGRAIGSIKIFRDVTADMELELHIWRTANTDSLTGLANRYAFGEYLKKLRPGATIHIFYIDLDNFKMVNDTWGHKAGDEVLRIVAKALRNVFSQDFPVRLGGDEFLVCVQRDVPVPELERLGASLLRRLHQKFSAQEKFSSISASIGIRAFGRLEDNIQKLIREADRAMYSAKKLGKGRYCFWEEHMKEEKADA